MVLDLLRRVLRRAERIEPLATLRQRYSARLARARGAIGLARGGRAVDRLTERLGMNASGDTFLGEVRRTTLIRPPESE